MKIRIGEHDLAVLNRGENRNDKKFLVIVDDEDKNFTNGANGGQTALGKSYMASILDKEADKHGAHEVVKGSTCRTGGEVTLYIDDQTVLYNKNEAVLFMDVALGELLIENGLATADSGW